MQKYKKVWILYTALFSIALAIVFLCFSDSAVLSDQQVDKPFFQIAFLAVILAPIIEELIFRGYFSSQKYLKWVSILLLPIFVILISTHLTVILLLASL
ncbi:CPBP family intramembrane metalloprotease [Bizionia myxarmorum]|uniref:CPBP family intramembrane metalloprotease n=1 Tax=Bizionia myxarmorum TaxID=291186 RepID=A0A5D0RD63_9FLAO|nr:CPBP family glutamic-type intramembrane protease [Bizionia myxarmorum]TYB78989.1 CPBP family intramembrane metalloprotease [Bizionia myxarmorum]